MTYTPPTRLCWDCATEFDLKKEFSEALSPLSDAITKPCSTCGDIAFTVAVNVPLKTDEEVSK